MFLGSPLGGGGISFYHFFLLQPNEERWAVEGNVVGAGWVGYSWDAVREWFLLEKDNNVVKAVHAGDMIMSALVHAHKQRTSVLCLICCYVSENT